MRDLSEQGGLISHHVDRNLELLNGFGRTVKSLKRLRMLRDACPEKILVKKELSDGTSEGRTFGKRLFEKA